MAKFIAEERGVCRVRSRINVDLIATLLMKLERDSTYILTLMTYTIPDDYRRILVLFDFFYFPQIFPSLRAAFLFFIFIWNSKREAINYLDERYSFIL